MENNTGTGFGVPESRAIRETIERGEAFLIATHIDPDGDALGSAFAMHFALEQFGKKSMVYLKDRVPYRYEFLPRPSLLIHGLPQGRLDAIFVVDCGSLFRIGEGWETLKGRGTVVNIDHHDANEGFGEINMQDDTASSTGEVLYRLFRSLGVRLNLEIAQNLYTAILTDTGSFRYDNTNEQAFTICEEMTRVGVIPSFVASRVYENHPKERFSLLCLVLATLQTLEDDRLAVAFATEEMFRTTRTDREYTEGFVEFLKEMKDVEVAAFARQIGPSKYKVSMRSKGATDVAAVARSLGGGGHKKAAGCVIEGSREEVTQKLVEALHL